MKILRTIDIKPDGTTSEPVQYVCYHPMIEKYLLLGITETPWGEPVRPSCAAVPYEYESFLHELCEALGWQGGTWDGAIREVKKLKSLVGSVEDKETRK